MLVLSRKRGEWVVIGGQIEVHVVEIRGNVVRLGFNAPTEVSVHRQEVYERVNGQSPNPRAAEFAQTNGPLLQADL